MGGIAFARGHGAIRTWLPLLAMINLAVLAGVAFDPLSQALSGVVIDISLPGLFLAAGGSVLLSVPFALRSARG